MGKGKRIVFSIVMVSIFFLGMTFPQQSDNVKEKKTKDHEPISQIVLLGTGTPNAEPDRSGPSVAIIVKERPYIVDCGPGVVRRASAAYQKGIRALDMGNLKRLFITHLHSDHTAGYPDIILTPWVLGRDEPLEVYGPSGIKSMTRHILKAYRKDIKVRIKGLEGANKKGYRVVVHEVKQGVVYMDEHVTIEAFPVKHGSWKTAFGYRFETPDRVIVVSGDCRPSKSLIKASKGCDVLIHEVYSQTGFEKRSKKWQKYHAHSHTSSYELTKVAKEVKPGLVILYHQLLWGTTPEALLEEIRDAYKGPVVFGKDLDVY